MKNTIFVFILVITLGLLQTTQAQFESLKKKAEDTIKKEIEKQPEVKDDKQNDNEAQTNDEKQDSQKQTGNNKTDETQTGDDVQFKSSTQYDFVPGENVIFFDDFSQDAVDNIPGFMDDKRSGRNKYNQYRRWSLVQLKQHRWKLLLLERYKFPEEFYYRVRHRS